MTKVMRYENGKAIAGQVDAPFKVDWSDWINMTDAQKKGKKWLIENVPGAEGEIDAELMTKLWENPNPAITFTEQNITLASDDYDFLFCSTRAGYAGTIYDSQTVIAQKGHGAAFYGNSGNDYRLWTYVNDTTYSIGNGYRAGSQNDGVQIPQAIYGFKKTVKIKFNALAKDVSTLASKCMLSDGVNNVEEAFGGVSLWSQSAGTFPASTFSIGNISKYKYFKVITTEGIGECLKGYSVCITTLWYNDNKTAGYERAIAIASDGTVTVYDAYAVHNGNVNNQRIVPFEIIGYI